MEELLHETYLIPLTPHPDTRGWFIELWREEWGIPGQPIQWNAALSRPGTYRGVHVHPEHIDYFTVVSGVANIGLYDMRRSSPTFRQAVMFDLEGESPRAICIPPGVGHGFFYPVETVHVYAGDRYYDPQDEMGCRWDDPDLGLVWPTPTFVSERDPTAPSLQEVLVELESFEI
jgi:dTDP-4-dehydrorhamnose 3,5-epimerase